MTLASDSPDIQTAMAHFSAGRWQQAEAICRQILRQHPSHADALHLLGLLAHRAGQADAAIGLIRQAIAAAPAAAHYHSNLGNILRSAGRFSEAIDSLQRAIALEPANGDQHRYLGMALQSLGRFDEAIACYRRSIELQPQSAIGLETLGVALQLRGQATEAEACYRKALAIAPTPEACCNLGHLLRDSHRVDEAAAAYRQAIALNRRFAEAYLNLGSTLQDQGCIDQAIGHLRTAVALRPDDPYVHGTLLFALLFDPQATDAELAAEQRLWEGRFARPLYATIHPHPNDRSPDRRLRIGYVSKDFCLHVVGTMLQPLLARHDRGQFEIFCYSNVVRPDAVTAQLKAHADQWRETAALSDEQLADLIRQDRIDILVDLGQHTAGKRLLLFARKPAPVQVSYLGYNAPTGLATIDYRLTDRWMESGFGFRDSGFGNSLSPIPEARNPKPDIPFFLPHCYWCYAPPPSAPAVIDPPAATTGHVTFGSFNSFAKVNPAVIAIWSQLLLAVPDSQLHIVIKGGQRNGHVWQSFQAHGIDPQRIKLLDHQPYGQHWALYQSADIALDPFPFNGGVSTLDCLWMGLPVVTLAGHRPLARAGLSILSNLDLPELIAQVPDQYVQIAAALANDLPRLAELRRTLRQRMQSSPLMNIPLFTRNLETAYRQMWRAWCGNDSAPPRGQ